MSDISKNIKRLREERGLTQGELAEGLHVTRQAVSNWENSKNYPDIELLMDMAEWFGVDVKDLLYGPVRGQDNKYRWFVVGCEVAALTALWAAVLCFGRAAYGMRLSAYISKFWWLYHYFLFPVGPWFSFERFGCGSRDSSMERSVHPGKGASSALICPCFDSAGPSLGAGICHYGTSHFWHSHSGPIWVSVELVHLSKSMDLSAQRLYFWLSRSRAEAWDSGGGRECGRVAVPHPVFSGAWSLGYDVAHGKDDGRVETVLISNANGRKTAGLGESHDVFLFWRGGCGISLS